MTCFVHVFLFFLFFYVLLAIAFNKVLNCQSTVGTSPTITTPVLPSMVRISPSVTVTDPTVSLAPASSIVMLPASATHGRPIPLAISAAWLVIPPAQTCSNNSRDQFELRSLTKITFAPLRIQQRTLLTCAKSSQSNVSATLSVKAETWNLSAVGTASGGQNSLCCKDARDVIMVGLNWDEDHLFAVRTSTHSFICGENSLTLARLKPQLWNLAGQFGAKQTYCNYSLLQRMLYVHFANSGDVSKIPSRKSSTSGINRKLVWWIYWFC